METQIGLGADIIMAFDECTEYPAEAARARASMEMTLRWAERSKKYFEDHKNEVPWSSCQLSALSSQQTVCEVTDGKTQALFGIVQGGMDRELRRESALRTVEIGFPGYAHWRAQCGRTSGTDSGDCGIHAGASSGGQAEIPYGSGHSGGDCALCAHGRGHDGLRSADACGPAWIAVHIGGASFDQAGSVCGGLGAARSGCACRVCQRYSRAYLRHLYAANELLAQVLNTVHNLHFYLGTMRQVRAGIRGGASGWS